MGFLERAFANTTAPTKEVPQPKQQGGFLERAFASVKTEPQNNSTTPAYKPIFSKVTTHKMPDSLGGGEFNLPANQLTTSTRSQDALPTKKGAERDHIVSVALGGTSNPDNLQYLDDKQNWLEKALGKKPTLEERQQGKIIVEDQAINAMKSGKLSVAEARGKVLQKQQEIKGLSPTKFQQTTLGQLPSAVKETVQDTGQGFKKIFKKATSLEDVKTDGIDPTLREQLIKRGEFDKLQKLEQEYLDTHGLKGFYAPNRRPVQETELDIIEKENRKQALEMGASILQAPQRQITSVAGETLAGIKGLITNKEEGFVFEPKTKFEKMVFGKEPIKGVFTRTDEAQKYVQAALEKAGVSPDAARGQAFAIAPLFMAGSIGLDLTPFGGEKNTAKLVAGSKNVDEIFDLIKPMLKGHADDEVRVIANELTAIDTAQGVKDILLKKVANPAEMKAAEVVAPEVKDVIKKPVVIDADLFKQQFNDFDPANSSKYSKMAEDQFDEAVKTNPNPIVKMTAGGPGSGKTEVLVPGMSNDFDGILADSPHSYLPAVRERLQKIAESGKKFEIQVLLRDPENARYFSLLREKETGRPVTLDYFIDKHMELVDTYRTLLREYPDAEIYVKDLRGISDLDTAINKNFVRGNEALDLLDSVKYNKSKLYDELKHLTIENYESARTAESRVKAGSGAGSAPQGNQRSTQEGSIASREFSQENKTNPLNRQANFDIQKQPADFFVDKKINSEIPFESRNPDRVIRQVVPETKKIFSKVEPKGEGVISANQKMSESTLKHIQLPHPEKVEQGIRDLSSKIEGKAESKLSKLDKVSYSETITKPLLSQGDAKMGAIINDLNDASHGLAEKFTTPPNILEKADKFKDISGFKAQARDVYRNFKHVFGDKYQDIKKTLLDPFDAAKGRYIDYQKKVLDEMDQKIVKGFGIRKGSKESAAVMDYGEGVLKEGELMSAFGTEKAKNIKQAAEWFRGKYDTLLEEVNAARKEIYPNNPDKIIPKRKDYFRHFEELSTGLGALKNIFENPAGISPQLAGISAFTTPRSKWLAFAQRRVLNDSTRDAVGGFLNYVPSASYAVNIDPFIGQFRKLGRELAEKTDGSRNINNFIEFLHDFSNDLSGKTNAFDRYIQKVIPGGRKTFGVINWLNNRVKANAILGNLSSAVSQIFNVPQGIASAKQYSIPGATRTLAQIFQPNDAMKLSSFIKERYSSSLYNKFDTGILANTKKFAAWVVGALDEVGTKFIWNSHYEKAIAEKIANPVKYADDITRSLVAGRGIGEVPLIQKSKLFQFVAPFQLEVGNLWYVMGDMVKGKDFAGLATLFVANYLMNRVAEKVRGSDVTFDPINALIEGFRNQSKDESIQGKGIKIAGRFIGEGLSNLPMGQTIASFYPEKGYDIPGVGQMTRSELFGEGDPTRFGTGPIVLGGLNDPLFKTLPPFAGGQIKKTYQGIKALVEGEQTSKSGHPQFEVSKTPENIIRAGAFGPYATTEGQEYTNAKDREASLQAAQTRKTQLEENKLQTKFDNIQNLITEQKNDEAVTEWNKLSDDEKAVYKRMKTKKKTQDTEAAELRMYPLVEKFQQLKSDGKEEEAIAEWEQLSDEEKRIYKLAKKKLGY